MSFSSVTPFHFVAVMINLFDNKQLRGGRGQFYLIGLGPSPALMDWAGSETRSMEGCCVLALSCTVQDHLPGRWCCPCQAGHSINNNHDKSHRPVSAQMLARKACSWAVQFQVLTVCTFGLAKGCLPGLSLPHSRLRSLHWPMVSPILCLTWFF